MLFSRAWWLDATAGSENWDVALVEVGGKIEASMPFVVTRRHGRSFLAQPPLTQALGPWMRSTDCKQANRIGREKDLMTGLIEQLPPFAHFAQTWHRHCTNWLPFYWAGFRQTTQYTYVLPQLSDLDSVWAGFRDNIRGDCRKAECRHHVKVRTDLGIDAFLRVHERSFVRQDMAPPYSDAFLTKVDEACHARNARQIFIAEDAEGNHHAGAYIVWDNDSAYYLMGGGDPLWRGSGAPSLCLWHAIQFASTVTRSFDFEGSMREPIERFFRAFGAEQVPLLAVSKTPSRLLRGYWALRGRI